MGSVPADEAFSIDKSIIFDDGLESYFSRTPSSAGNRKTWTWSAWLKRNRTGTTKDETIFSAYDDSSETNATWFEVRFTRSGFSDGEDALSVNGWSSSNWRVTSRKFRDTSAWYHIVITVNTTEASADNRIKIYVNGVQETAFAATSTTDLGQNADLGVNATQQHRLGSVNYGSGINERFFNGYMAEVNFIDGTALAASHFGETDADTDQWIPKEYDTASGAYGTNGFRLAFPDTDFHTGTLAATGGTVTTVGDYKVHTFNSSGTFTVTSVSGDAVAYYLVIGGGGGGAGASAGSVSGSGGAGGYRSSWNGEASGGGSGAEFPLVVSAQAYTVTVGAGGAGGAAATDVDGSQGANSVFGSITSVGGGEGAAYASGSVGGTGGSGGGSSWNTAGVANGGSATADQGYSGGTGTTGGPYLGGAGGGAAGPGSGSSGGSGGDGLPSTITGSSVTRGGGGGVNAYATWYYGGSAGAGGAGGGGSGSSNNGTPGAGTANTGGGGGGSSGNGVYGGGQTGATGGSGVVIIRYKFQ